MSDKELNLIGYINVDGSNSNSNITGSINENGSSNNLVGSTINTSLEFVVLKGASAYEVAKNNGYKGTVEEWLNDLRYDHSEEFLEFANGIQNQINALAERHEKYEEKFDGLNEKIDSKVIPTKVSEFENDKGYLTEHQDISNLATKKELNDGLVGKSDVGHTHEQYLTEHQSLDKYAKVDDVYGKEEVYSKEETYSKSEVEEIANNSGKVKTVNGIEPDDKGNVAIEIPVMPEIPTKVSQLENDSNYLTEHQSLDEYAKKSEIPTLDGFVSEQWVQEQGYLTEHQDLSDYAKKSDISNVYKYIGSVETYSSLPLENVNIGDVYNVEDDSQNYAWNGTEWDSLGSIIDLSNYCKKEDVYSKDDIDNKIPYLTSQLSNNSGYITNNDLVNPDWNEYDQSSKSFIKNKPYESHYEKQWELIIENNEGGFSRNGAYTLGYTMRSIKNICFEEGKTYRVSIWCDDEKIEKEIVAEKMYAESVGGLGLSKEQDKSHTIPVIALVSDGYYDCTVLIDGLGYDLNKFTIFSIDASNGADPFKSSYFYCYFTYNNPSITGAGSSSCQKFAISSLQNVEIVTKQIDGKYVSGVLKDIDPKASGTFSLNRKKDSVIGTSSVAIGYYTTASGNFSHAEGYDTTSSGASSHAEGNNSSAIGMSSHSEGYFTTANGDYGSHAEGWSTTASGSCSHAEGGNTIASGNYSHAEGMRSRTGNTSKYGSTSSTTDGYASHAEGYGTLAKGRASHSEGNGTTATGYDSHAEGYLTTASGNYSHAEGYNTTASGDYQHVQGKYNILENSTFLHIVGNGTSSSVRSNAHTLDNLGNAWYAGDVYVGSTSGTNRDEGSKKLATEEYVDDVIANISDIVLQLNANNVIDIYENDDGDEATYKFLSDELTNRFDEIYNKLQNNAINIYADLFGLIKIPLTYIEDDNLYGNYIGELDGAKYNIRWHYYNPVLNKGVSFRVDIKLYKTPSLTIGNLSYNGEESIDFSEEINRLIEEKISESIAPIETLADEILEVL